LVRKPQKSLLKTEYFWKQVMEFSVLWRKSCHDCDLNAKYSQHLLPLSFIPVSCRWQRFGLWYLTPLSTMFQLYRGGVTKAEECTWSSLSGTCCIYVVFFGYFGFLCKIRKTGLAHDIIELIFSVLNNCAFYFCATSSTLYIGNNIKIR
jgi:hypothetical protein